VECALVDCLGHRTSEVYKAVLARQHRRVIASVGKAGGESGQLVSTPKAVKTPHGAVSRAVIDADQVKSLLYSRLRLDVPGPEFIHLPFGVGETFVDELTAERLVTRRNKFGVPEKRWQQVRDRNETLDCFGMALAALRIIAPTTATFAALAAKVRAAAKAAAVVPSGAPQAPRVKPSGYLGR
jgi:phage terminase large subunit GpA-like protein